MGRSSERIRSPPPDLYGKDRLGCNEIFSGEERQHRVQVRRGGPSRVGGAGQQSAPHPRSAPLRRPHPASATGSGHLPPARDHVRALPRLIVGSGPGAALHAERESRERVEAILGVRVPGRHHRRAGLLGPNPKP